ncbi:MAG: TetR/AcrR family transcriptional regulator [Tannerellaceae bacterium]|jgi:AcrR family transcriptional regulator|nr:TetR/AcrR family transcriptional regulator [Tannerellaceae bacterium]
MEEVNDMESRILEAAKSVFVSKGYEATKMRDVAAKVGISRTAMHYYFRTKEMLFEAIFGQLIGSLLPDIDAMMREGTTILEKLPGIIQAYMSALEKNPLFPIFVINEMNRDPEHLYRAVVKNSVRIEPVIRLKRQISEEVEKGALKNVSLMDISSTLLGLIVFPLLVRHPLTTLFAGGDSQAFDDFYVRRRALAYEVMYRLLAPDKTENKQP